MNIAVREFDLESAYKHLTVLTLGDGTRLRTERLRDILSQDMVTNICASIPNGTLRWASPASDEIVETNKGLWLSHYVLAYRLKDKSGGSVSYILISSSPARVVGIYFPAEGVLFRGEVLSSVAP
jgi:hypothetical protein